MGEPKNSCVCPRRHILRAFSCLALRKGSLHVGIVLDMAAANIGVRLEGLSSRRGSGKPTPTKGLQVAVQARGLGNHLHNTCR